MGVTKKAKCENCMQTYDRGIDEIDQAPDLCGPCSRHFLGLINKTFIDADLDTFGN